MNWQRRKGVVDRVHYDYPQYPPLFHPSEAIIAKMGPCVLDEGTVIRYVLAELFSFRRAQGAEEGYRAQS